MATPLTLKVFRGDELVRTEQFARDIIKIGRLSSAHLSLDDEKISRIHSVIEVANDGSISVIDMGSAEGTYVNGRRVNRGPLHSGDQIGLGGLRILVEAPNGSANGSNGTSHEPGNGSGNGSANGHAAPSAVEVAAAPTARPPPEPRIDETTGAEPIPREAAPAVDPQPPPPAAARAAPAPAPVRREVPVARLRSSRLPATAAPPVQKPVRAEGAAEPEVEAGTELGVELRLLWGDTLLDAATFVQPGRPVLVGDGKGCDFHLSGPELPVNPFPILRYEESEYRVLFARGMTGEVVDGGSRTPLAHLAKERKAHPDGAIEGAYSVAVPLQGSVRVELGSGLRFECRFRRPPKPAVVPWWERVNYQFLNLFLLLFFLQAGFIVAAGNYPYDTDTVADDLFKNPSRMAKFIIKPPDQQPKSNPYLEKLQRELAREQSGEAAERHKGVEGQMGKKDAPRTNARSAPKAIDPNAKDIVKNSGLVGLLGRGRGAGGLSTIFGQGGLGGDLKGAIGNMFGPVVGDSQGIGGLGLKGSGTGGGGSGETIGIGGVGTKGRGGGLGSYGTGVGGLGKKSDRDVSIQTGAVAVLGAIDKELIRKVIQEHASQIRYCYEQELTRDPKLEGKVAIRWVINADGRVSSPQVDTGATTLMNDKVHHCMMERIASWEFPKPKGGGIAVITYPWILRASGGAGG